MQSSTISIYVNGQLKETPAGQTLAELLTWLQIAGERVAVEMNRGIVRKRDWDRARVEPGAAIEIVEFVGGG